jgi:hypothetical protein
MLASSALIHSSRFPVAEVAGRRAAGVGHDDVEVLAQREHGGAAFGRGDVGGDGLDLRALGRALSATSLAAAACSTSAPRATIST